MAKLATYVHVTDDKGAAHVFGPADEVPAWAVSRITNPKAWAEAPEPAVSHVSALTPPRRAAPAKRTTARRKASDAPVHGD